ncbi:unnamed protein product, partial [Protopolystoma xenopodis]
MHACVCVSNAVRTGKQTNSDPHIKALVFSLLASLRPPLLSIDCPFLQFGLFLCQSAMAFIQFPCRIEAWNCPSRKHFVPVELTPLAWLCCEERTRRQKRKGGVRAQIEALRGSHFRAQFSHQAEFTVAIADRSLVSLANTSSGRGD